MPPLGLVFVKTIVIGILAVFTSPHKNVWTAPELSGCWTHITVIGLRKEYKLRETRTLQKSQMILQQNQE